MHLLDQLHQEVQSVEDRLRQAAAGYKIGGRICLICERQLPDAAKKCRPCHNADLHKVYCTSQSRVTEYFAILKKNGLWPSVEPFQRRCVSELASRISSIEKEHGHQCEAGPSCPLQRELESLSKRVWRIVTNINGITIRL